METVGVGTVMALSCARRAEECERYVCVLESGRGGTVVKAQINDRTGVRREVASK